MAQIVQPQPTWQEALGSGLGSGIQSGVTALLEQKLQSMAQEQQANQRMKALEGLQKSGVLGESFTPEALSALKYAPESLLNTLLKERMKAPANQAYAQAAAEIASDVPQAEVLRKYPGLTGPQINALTTAAADKAKTLRKEKEFGINLNKDWRNELQKNLQQNAISRAELGRLKTLIKSGETLAGVGSLVPKEIQNSATQEANKIIQRLITQNAQNSGGRPTDYKLQQLAEGFAELGTTREATLNAIHGTEELLKIDELVSDAADQIEKEYGGIPPHNLNAMAWKRATPKINEILDNIEKGREAAEGWMETKSLSKYPPEKYKGKTIEFSDGSTATSDGRAWVKNKKVSTNR